MSTEDAEQLVISDDGIALPAIEVLTGRGVIFGKSGSGKSNSASVIIEELLERGFPLLIVDIEGEYYTLKERYEVVHIGATDKADMPLRETEPEQVVTLCLDRNRPVIIDLSEVMDMDPAEYFVDQVITILFSREKEARKPFLVVVEEIHEFLPQQGGLDDLGETLIRIAKRGRKRGLGMAGMSQRPAAVDKEFITQCDWLVWHRLTWKNDTQVVQSILGSEKAQEVQELATGEGIMMTDWDEMIRTVKFRRKRTYDAADTPTLSPENRPDLTTDGTSSSVTSQQRLDQTEPSEAGAESEVDGDGEDAEETVTASSVEQPAEATNGGGSGTDQGDVEANEPSDEATRTRTEDDDSRSQDADDELRIKSFEPPGSTQQTTNSGTGGASTYGTPPTTREESVTDVPKKHADPPFEDGDSRTALWEFGHMVAYVVATLLAIVARTGRYAIRYAKGTEEGPFDPLEPASTDGDTAPLTRDQMVLIISALLLVVILVFGVVMT
ncbi:MAG: helicase HerA domain-containing protein [Halanaeroarchaeum sp.]